MMDPNLLSPPDGGVPTAGSRLPRSDSVQSRGPQPTNGSFNPSLLSMSADYPVSQAASLQMPLLTVCQPDNDDDGSAGYDEGQGRSSLCMIVVRWITTVVIGAAFLTCLVGSKLTVLIIGASISKSINSTKSGGRGERYEVFYGEMVRLPEGSEDPDVAASFWWLVLILMVPYVYSLVRSLWMGGFRGDRPWPSRRAVIAGVIASVLESAGMSLFGMFVLTTVPITLTTWLMNGVFAVPILLQMISTLRGAATGVGRSRKAFIVCLVVALVLELVGIGLSCVVVWKKFDSYNWNVNTIWAVPLSLALLSIAWCPELQKQQLIPSQQSFQNLYQRFRQRRPTDFVDADSEHVDPSDVIFEHPEFSARWKNTIITSTLRLVLVFGFSLASVRLFEQCTHDFKIVDFSQFGAGFYSLTPKHVMFGSFMANIFCSMGGCVLGFLSCTMCMQRPAFAIPLILATPVSFILVVTSALNNIPPLGGHDLFNGQEDRLGLGLEISGALCLVLAEVLSTGFFIFKTQTLVMERASQLFWLPGYNGVFLEQTLLLGRKSIQTNWQQIGLVQRAQQSQVIICTTMYREAKHEMEQLLQSIKQINRAKQINDRKFESHVFFDNGVRGTKLSDFALQLTCIVKSVFEVTSAQCTKVLTPYGMRLTWRLPSVIADKQGMHFSIHLKDNQKVKSKKRWSQVMYMSYVLDYYIREHESAEFDNTFILTTDADVKFKPESVEALLDLMLRDKSVGAVCSRTFPMGSGPVYWYQIFDYAIGHWLGKAANHILGSVLCCPGCFSVYRVQAIRDVLPAYGSQVTEASEFLTKDMGEDRWLCTLLVQKGWRLEYCALADNSTYCPEDFEEFFNQRRRWMPSTFANQLLLLKEWKKLSRNNKQISYLFMIYQAFLFFSTLINPALCITLISGGLLYAFEVSMFTSLIFLILTTAGFVIVCLKCSQKTQLQVAKVLTCLSSMLMAAVTVGIAVQIVDELKDKGTDQMTTTPRPSNHTLWHAGGSATTETPHTANNMSVNAYFLAGISALYILTALMHLPEAYCLFHGVWYLLCLPTGNVIMMIYSICNLTDRSWGTREEKQSDLSISTSYLDDFVNILKKIFFCCSKESKSDETDSQQPAGYKPSVTDEADVDDVDGSGTPDRLPRRSSSFRSKTSDARQYQFANIFASSQPIPVRDWLPKNLRDCYAESFEEHGYDDTSYLYAMTDGELKYIGVSLKAHRNAIIEAMKYFPEPEIEPCVPDNIDQWLENIGLSMYVSQFHKAHIVSSTNMEVLKVMKRNDIKRELGISKAGHQKRLLLAISKLRHPTPMEKEQMQTKHEIDALVLHNMKVVQPQEFDFWEKLRVQRLLPESTVFAHDLDLKEKLTALRDSWLLVFSIANAIWLILILTIANKKDLQLNFIKGNILGLTLLVVSGVVLIIQFIAMVLHRISTWVHLVARTPYLRNAPMRASWAFRDLTESTVDANQPSEDELEARRQRNAINRRLMRYYEQRVTDRLVATVPADNNERQPLLGTTAARRLGDSTRLRNVNNL